jgi:uncharacterized RDD family membrane protein YckC
MDQFMKMLNCLLPFWLTAALGLAATPALQARQSQEAVADSNAVEGAAANAPVLEQDNAENQTATGNTNADVIPEVSPSHSDGNWEPGQAMVLVGQNAELKAGETAEAVVVIGGNAVIHGHVRHGLVVVGGDITLDGEVGDAAVAVMGNISMEHGAVVHQTAVAVLGNLKVAPGATIGQNAVSVAGKLDVAEGAKVLGQKIAPAPNLKFDRLTQWLKYCVFELRLLAFQVHWVWVVAGLFFLMYLFVTVVFPRPVEVCIDGLARRPATTFLLGLLTTLVAPIVFLLLAITGIGLIAVPFVAVALIFAAWIGKAALLQWIGIHLGRPLGSGFQKPVPAFLLGSILITLLYLVPLLGLMTFAMTGVWSLGCAVAAAFGSLRRELPDRVPAPPPTYEPPAAAPPPSPLVTTTGLAATPVAGGTEAAITAPTLPDNPGAPAPGPTPPAPASAAAPALPPVYSYLLSYPKAGFWERMAAGLLDLLIIGILGIFLHFVLLVALAYFVAMWTWKGTTIGGIVLKLQVVRADGAPLNVVVALVRGLAAAFSVAALFIGFLWIAWDKDKQGWHDKIAGTVVVRLPQSMPLVCV